MVVDDYSRILVYDLTVFHGWKKKLQGKHQDVMEALNLQLFSTKIKRKQVENWLKIVEDIIGLVAKDVEDQVSGKNSS